VQQVRGFQRLALAALVLGLCLPARASDFDVQRVARAGDPLPLPGAPAITGFLGHFVDAAGNIVFNAPYGDSFGYGVFRTAGSSLVPIVRDGDPAPGTGGGIFGWVHAWDVSPSGDVLLRGYAGDDVVVFEGLFLASEGGIAPIVVSGDASPVDGWLFHAVGPSAVADGGRVLFRAHIRTSPELNGLDGIFLAQAGEIEIVALEGDVAPGTGGQSFLTFTAPDVNAAGDLAFRANFGGSVSSDGLFARAAGGALRLVAKAGDGLPGGGVIEHIDPNLSQDTLGQIAFSASSGGVAGGAILVDAGGSLREVARRGQPAPGTPGAFFHLSMPSIHLGRVAFQSTWDPNGLGGIFVEGQGALLPVALVGEPAPGFPGAVFYQLLGPVLTASGDVVFVGEAIEGSTYHGAALYRARAIASVPALGPAGVGLCAALLAAACVRTLRRPTR
jgi:hypothetical protein